METQTKIQEILDQQKQRQTVSVEENYSNALNLNYYGVWKGAIEELNERYLDLRFRNGQRTSFDYPDRKFVNYNPEMPCIDIDFAGNMVTIIGRELEPLYELFLQRKVQWVRETDSPKKEDRGEGLYIEEILITPADRDNSDSNEQTN